MRAHATALSTRERPTALRPLGLRAQSHLCKGVLTISDAHDLRCMQLCVDVMHKHASSPDMHVTALLCADEIIR